MSVLDNNTIYLTTYWTKLSHKRNVDRTKYGLQAEKYKDLRPGIKNVEKVGSDVVRRPTLMDDCRESLNPETKDWRESLRSFERCLYEERTYTKPSIAKTKPIELKDVKDKEVQNTKPNVTGKQSKSKSKKAVKWSKKK